jgi:hypothetical protein
MSIGLKRWHSSKHFKTQEDRKLAACGWVRVERKVRRLGWLDWDNTVMRCTGPTGCTGVRCTEF